MRLLEVKHICYQRFLILSDLSWFVCGVHGVIVGDKKIIPSKGINLFWNKAKHIYLQDNQEVHKLQAKKKT